MGRLLDRGDQVAFRFVGGRELDLPTSWVMLHDKSGSVWPRCSLLFTRPPPTPNACALTGDERSYLGRVGGRSGHLELPARSLEAWREVGRVERAWYWRSGIRYPQYFQHGFAQKTLVFKSELPSVLYKTRGFYRLELPNGCIVNARGFVKP